MKFSALLAALALIGAVAAQTPARDRMVIVISLDGFPAYDLDDPKLPIPTMRKLIQNGVRSSMIPVNPTVTWPNHTTMVTGVRSDEHGLLTNGGIVRTGAWPPLKVDAELEKEKLVHVPTVYDAAYKAGLTTAQVDWVAISRAPTITWAFSETASPDGPLEQEMIRKSVITTADVTDFTKANILFRDQIWTTAATYLIREHKPNLLLVHFLTLDSTHHRYGPRTLAADAAIAFLDSCVARILESIHAAGMADKTTLFIVADHGFKAYTKQIHPAIALADAQLGDKAYVMAEGGTAYVYFEPSADMARKVTQALSGVEGIDQILGPDKFAGLNVQQPEHDPQMYQLLLSAKDGYSFSGTLGGPVTAAVAQQGGSHGYLASDPDMAPLFIASGYGVRTGAKIDPFPNVDVAPTLVQLLGVSLPTAKGKPIPLQ